MIIILYEYLDVCKHYGGTYITIYLIWIGTLHPHHKSQLLYQSGYSFYLELSIIIFCQTYTFWNLILNKVL